MMQSKNNIKPSTRRSLGRLNSIDEGINEAFYQKIFFLRHQAVNEVDLNMDQQVCVIKTVAYRANTDTHTHRHTHTWTDKSLKTEGHLMSTIARGGSTAKKDG